MKVIGIDSGNIGVLSITYRVEKIFKSLLYRSVVNPTDYDKSPLKKRGTFRTFRKQLDRKTRDINYFKEYLINLGFFKELNISTLEELNLYIKDKNKEKINFYVELVYKSLTSDITLSELGFILIYFRRKRGISGKIKSSDYKKIRKEFDKIDKKTITEFLYENYILNGKTIKGFPITKTEYQFELNKILDKNTQFMQELGITKNILIEKLYHRRPLKSSKHLISPCTIKGNCKKSIKKSRPIAEIFRILSDVNKMNIKDQNKPSDKGVLLDEKQKEIVFNHLIKCKTVNLISLGKKLKIQSNEKLLLNDKEKAKGAESILILKDIFNLNVDLTYKKLVNSNDIEQELAELDKKWDIVNIFHFNEEELSEIYPNLNFENVSKLDNGYIKYSYDVSKEIIEYLLSGYNEYKAKVFTSIKYSFSDKKLWDDVKCNIIPEINDVLSKEYDNSTKHEEVINYLKTKFDGLFQEERIFNGGDNIIDSLRKIYPNKNVFELAKIAVKSITSSIVRVTVSDFIRFLEHNRELLEDIDLFVLERATETLTDKEITDYVTKSQKNEEENKKCKDEIRENGFTDKITEKRLLKYKLWKEQKGLDVYTFKPISFYDIFDDKYDVDHILPKSIYKIDSYDNKVLTERSVNKNKTNKTPYEYFSNHKEIIEKAKELKLSNDKIIKISWDKDKEKWVDKYGIENSQLNLSRYISKIIFEIISSVIPKQKILQVSGSLTSVVRSELGLGNILNEDNNDYTKNRSDNRSHAIDSITLSLMDFNLRNKFNSKNTFKQVKKEDITAIKGWDNYYDDIKKHIDGLVTYSHNDEKSFEKREKTHHIKKDGKIIKTKGVSEISKLQLHGESQYKYNKTYDCFTFRTAISDLNTTKIKDIIGNDSLINSVHNWFYELPKNYLLTIINNSETLSEEEKNNLVNNIKNNDVSNLVNNYDNLNISDDIIKNFKDKVLVHYNKLIFNNNLLDLEDKNIEKSIKKLAQLNDIIPMYHNNLLIKRLTIRKYHQKLEKIGEDGKKQPKFVSTGDGGNYCAILFEDINNPKNKKTIKIVSNFEAVSNKRKFGKSFILKPHEKAIAILKKNNLIEVCGEIYRISKFSETEIILTHNTVSCVDKLSKNQKLKNGALAQIIIKNASDFKTKNCSICKIHNPLKVGIL